VGAGCGSSGDSSESTSGSTASSTTASGGGEGVKVALMTPAQRNDGGLTQFSLEGVNKAVKDLNGDLTSVVDNVSDPQKQVQTLRTLAQNKDIVIADSATLNQAVDTVAPAFPDTTFLLVAGVTKQEHDNVTSLNPQPGLDAVVIGAVAAERSKSKKLGMIAGSQVPASEAWAFGMKQGAGLQDKSATVASTYTGDYNDVGKAKQAAEAMIANGVDQIIADLDSGSEGIYQAADAANGKVDVYQVFGLNCDATDAVVGSGVINWSSILEDGVKSAADGTLKPGMAMYTLKSPDAVSFQFCPGKAQGDEQKIADDVTKQLADGQITPAEGVLDADPGYTVVQK
jgi:basic membrane protein A